MRSSAPALMQIVHPGTLHLHFMAINKSRLSIKLQLSHRIVLAVPSPEGGFLPHGGRRYERVSEFQIVAFAELAEEFASHLASTVLNRDTCERAEEAGNGLVFAGAGACPNFRGIDGREQDQRSRISQSRPLRHDGLVSAAQDFDHYVGIEKNTHSIPNRSIRLSSRMLRM